MKKFLLYFMRGLLVTVPVAITSYVVYSLIQMVGHLVDGVGTIVNPSIDPFLVPLIAIVIIFIMGLLGSSIILSPIFSIIENAIEHTPVVKTIYTSIKDLMSAFVGNKKRFNKPVLVTIDKANNIQQVGFITNESLKELNINEGQVAVYLPWSYSFAGNLIVVPKESIKLIDASSTEVMKFIVSGGVTDIN